MVDVIIIRGAPGSGKTQTAKSLAKYFPKGIRLEVDNIRQMVISVDWTNQKEHIDMLQVSSKLILEFLTLNYKPVIVIDTFSGDKINRFLQKLVEGNDTLQSMIFGLFTTEEELKSRLDKRSEEEFKDHQISKKLNSDVLKWKLPQEIQIDTTGISSEQTAKLIYELVNSNQGDNYVIHNRTQV